MSTPVRPQSSYMHFVAANKAAVVLEHPTAPFFEIANLLNERWSHLGTGEKAKYHELAKQDRARYRQEMEQHKALAAAGIRLRAAKGKEEDRLSSSGSDLEEDSIDEDEDWDDSLVPPSALPTELEVEEGPRPMDAVWTAVGSSPFLTAVSLEELQDAGEREVTGPPTAEQHDVDCIPEPTSHVVEVMPVAFKAFINESRRAIADQNPNLSFRELARLVREKWRSLSSEEQRRYGALQCAAPESCIREPDNLRCQSAGQTAKAVYFRAERQALMQGNPGLTYREAARLCMHGWALLSEEERNFYAP
eukprot:GGOE01058191.1.p1 GENE.GGOE01058191.1~~GGOE01058191.1.p1  ORF type:complete len:306 (+),score=78.20 GGOE01058191.1:137-1054(+)